MVIAEIRSQNIQVECLDSIYNLGTTASINYFLPISSVFTEKSALVEVDYERYYGTLLDKDTKNVVLDSLRAFYFEKYPSDKEKYRGRLFYSREELPATKKHSLNGHYKTDTLLSGGYYQYTTAWLTATPHNKRIVNESYINTPIRGEIKSDIQHATLLNPKFFSRFDISQEYFRIRIKSHSVDSIALCVCFNSAVDIAPMGEYYPKRVTGDRVEYSIKPQYNSYSDGFIITTGVSPTKSEQTRYDCINKNGTEVLFHVRFRDLENVQARRVFLVTAVMSALITIFLAFIIIFPL